MLFFPVSKVPLYHVPFQKYVLYSATKMNAQREVRFVVAEDVEMSVHNQSNYLVRLYLFCAFSLVKVFY